MKKFNEIYAEALKNEELRNELTQAVSERKITEFLKAHDCDSDTDEIIEFLTEQQAKTQRGDIELNIDDLEDVAGGSNRFVAILLAGLTLTSTMTPIAAAAAEDNSVPTEYVLDVEQEEDDIDLDFDFDEEITAEETTTQTTAETTTETTETTVETFVPLDLVKEEEEEEKEKDSFDEFMNDALSSLWDTGKSKLGENLPTIVDKIFDSIPVVNSLNKIGLGKTLGGLLANVLGISPEKQPTMKEISDQIKELSDHIDSVKGEIIKNQDDNLYRAIVAMEGVEDVSTYKTGMQQLSNAFMSVSGKMTKTSKLSEQEKLVLLASLCGSSADWTATDKLVGALSIVGSYMSGQHNFISNENYYDSLYSLAVKHGAIFSGQAKREVEEYVTNSLETYTAAYAYAMASLEAQEVLVRIKNSGEYEEFLNSLSEDMKATCESIVANKGDIKAKKKALARLFADVEGTGNTNTVLGQYEKFMSKSNGIFILREGQFDHESKDITVSCASLRCDDSQSGSTPSNKIYANLMKSNKLVTDDTKMIDTILDYAERYDMTIAQVIESAGLEIPANTRYILADTKIHKEEGNYQHTTGSYVGSADLTYSVEVYDIYSKEIKKVKTPIKAVRDVVHHYDNSDPRHFYTVYYVNTVNFLTFCQKPDNTSAFGSVIDEDHYSLSSGTYTLNDNIDISAPVIIPSGANVTVDLNGYTVNRGCDKAADNGQAFIVSTGASLTIIDSAGNGKVTGAYAKNGGAVFVDVDANCSVQGGIFTGNRTDEKGGAFINYGTLTIENAVVSGNTSNDGGAIYNANGGKLNIKGSQLNNNKAVVWGGGAVSNHGELNVENSEMNGNSAEKSDGGAIFTEGTTTITDSTFNGNKGGDGGAIYTRNKTVTIKGSNFSNNSTVIHGGGAISAHSELTMDNFTITGNNAKESGGGIYSDSTLKLTNGTINNNTTNSDGGAVKTTKKSEITNVEMNGNNANNGGAVYNQGNCVVRNCNICNNTAKDRGGAFNVAGNSTTMVYDSTICDNSASKGSLLRYESDNAKYRIDPTNTTNGSIY